MTCGHVGHRQPSGRARRLIARQGGRSGLIAVVLLAAAPVDAQGTLQSGPSAGAISSQVLSRQQATVQAAPPPSIPPPASDPVAADPPAARLNEGAVAPFVLVGVDFDPSHFLPHDRLQAIAVRYVGHEIGAAELAEIVAGVNRLYDDRGLVTARAVLLPGAVSGGRVHVSLVEGRVGRITVTGNGRLPADRAIDRVGLVPGEVIDVAALRHRLALLNRATDTRTRAALQPGDQFGLTDIQLSLVAPEANVVELFGDNEGYDSAGRYEGSAYYRRTGILGASDRFTGYLSGSAGLLSGIASYDAPLLGATSRIGLSYGRSRIDIVDGVSAERRSRGVTESESINYSRPIASSDAGLLVASLTAGISSTRNYLGSDDLGATRTHRAGAGLAYSYAAPGTSAVVSINGLYANAPVGGSARESDFAVFSGTGSAEHLFGRWSGVHLAAGWQVATASYLPSDLLFQIGGATTVRGYRQGELTGDGGYYLNLEAELLPIPAARPLTLFAFVDQGRVFTPLSDARSLTAVGIGTTAALGRHLTLRITAGQPIERIADEAKKVQLFGRLGVTF